MLKRPFYYDRSESEREAVYEEAAYRLVTHIKTEVEALKHLEPKQVEPYKAKVLQPFIQPSPEELKADLLRGTRIHKALDTIYLRLQTEAIIDQQRSQRTEPGVVPERYWRQRRNSVSRVMSSIFEREEDRRIYPSASESQMIQNLAINPDYVTADVIRKLELFEIDPRDDAFTLLRKKVESFPTLKTIFQEATPLSYGASRKQKVHRILVLHTGHVEGKILITSQDYAREQGRIPDLKKIQVFDDAYTALRSLDHTQRSYQRSGEHLDNEEGMIPENLKITQLVHGINVKLAHHFKALSREERTEIQETLAEIGVTMYSKRNRHYLNLGDVFKKVSTLKSRDGRINPGANAATLLGVLNHLDNRFHEMVGKHQGVDGNIAVLKKHIRVSEATIQKNYETIEAGLQQDIETLAKNGSPETLARINARIDRELRFLRAEELAMQPFLPYALQLKSKLELFQKTCEKLINFKNPNYVISMNNASRSVRNTHTLSHSEKMTLLSQLNNQAAVTPEQRKQLESIYTGEAKRRVVEAFVTAKIFIAQKMVHESVLELTFHRRHYSSMEKVITHLKKLQKTYLDTFQVFPEIEIEQCVHPYRHFVDRVKDITESLGDLSERDRQTRPGQQLNLVLSEQEIAEVENLDTRYDELIEELKALDFMAVVATMDEPKVA